LVARSQGELKGPVHLNCMFREPLEPLKTDKDFTDYLKSIKEWSKTTKPYARYIYSQKTIGKNDLDDISTRLNRIKKGIIIVGKIKELDQKSILSLSEKLKWPIFPDISSGFRIQNNHKHIISSFDSLLLSDKFKARNQIDGILHLGGRITSKRWYEWIKKSFLNEYIMVLNHPLRNDPFHNVSLRVQSPVGVFCQKIIPKIALQKSSSALKSWQDGERRLQIKMKNIFNEMRQLNEPLVARLISEYIPVKTALFLSSSMPIRTMDQYAYQNNRDINIGANRGASGIDGVIASACGFSKGLKKRVTLLIGDLAFCYDMNSLMMLKDLPQAMTIILINNNGGGIFNLLPIAQYKDVFEKYFAGPHNLEFSQLAMNFGLNYHSPDSIQKFIDVYQQCMLKKNSSLIEIKIERTHNTEIINEIQRKLIRFY
ncbi:MAG: 2-succinyl-5-enolpyruvyl-6-hydroxy-3-cyclohexene-1-carboxylate synthase, partial [Candidatus Omnitrophica bacterium]|nr:2-succinyl-5-enolpyruvyl-6-hydroxy-3-cyclohexene-1-carboxylate synthase [Candidatus Omnitrophota bacterium]